MNRNSNHVQWLHDELPRLVEMGVLDEEAALSLKNHYLPIAARNTQTMVFVILATLGSLLVGLGVVLLFGYNWDSISRSGKAGIAFAPLLISSALAAYALHSRPLSEAWREGASLAVAISAAACIGLVSQAYQISGDLKSFYSTWLWISLPLLFGFRSRSVFVLLLFVVCLWAPIWHSRVQLFDVAIFLVVNGSCLAFLLREGRLGLRSFLFFSYAVSSAVGLIALLGALLPAAWPSWAAAFFTVIYLWDRGATSSAESWKAKITGALAWAALLAVCVSLTFDDVWPSLSARDHLDTAQEYVAIAMALGLLACYLAFVLRDRDGSHWERNSWAYLPIVAFGGNIMALVWKSGDTAAAIVMNLYLLAAAVVVGIWGFRSQVASRMNQGLFVIVALAVVRFFDSDFGMVARGLGFVFIGSAFLLANLVLLKHRKEAARV